jgi:uncharacterized membrane protein
MKQTGPLENTPPPVQAASAGLRLPNWLIWLHDNLSMAGVAMGSILFALSLTPSLLSRTPLIQGLTH